MQAPLAADGDIGISDTNSDLQEFAMEDTNGDIPIEIEDLVEEVVEEPTDGAHTHFTLSKQECSKARSFLKIQGDLKFLDEYLPGTATAQDILNLIKLLGFLPKTLHFHENDDESNLLQLIRFLQKAMHKVMTMRTRIVSFNSIDHLCSRLLSAKNVMVLTGAGISTSLGIPDFRSSKGFYAKLENLGLSDPQEVFDIFRFKEDPQLFYSIAHMVLPPTKVFTPLHAFIRLLQDKGKLLRNYTQNIDNLESNVGVLQEKLIQCHGSFGTASCITCQFQMPGDLIFDDIRGNKVPVCPFCKEKRNKMFEKYENSDKDEYLGRLQATMKSFGVMKPDITFFGENLPERYHNSIKEDLMKCDLLLCIGTSLKVAPVSEIVNKLPNEIPQVLINKDIVPHCEFDINIMGYCDSVIVWLVRQLNRYIERNEIVEEPWKIPHSGVESILESGLEVRSDGSTSGVFDVSTYMQRKQEHRASLQEEQNQRESGNTDGDGDGDGDVVLD